MPDASPNINTGTDLSSVVSGLNGKTMDNATYQKGEASLIKENEKVRQEEKNIPLAKPPELTKAPDQKDYTTNPMETFGSFGMVLAALGSAMTKHPMTSALNAGAEVFKAKNAADAAGYKNAMDKWKVDSENAWKMADWDQKNFENMRSKYKDDLEGLNREAELWAAATKNPALDAAAKAGQVQEYFDSHQKAVMEMNDARENKQKKNDVYQGKLDDWLEANKNPDGTTKKIEEIPKSVTAKIFEETENEWKQAQSGKLSNNSAAYAKNYELWKEKKSSIQDANDYANGAPIANIIRGRGKEASENLQMIKDLAEELHPGFDRNDAVQDYNAANKAISSFGSGKQGDIVRSFNVAYNHADLVGDLADALQNGDVQRINALSQTYEQEFGSAAPTNFDAAKHILADEINKAAIGGAGALADRQALTANILRSSSPDQIKGQLDTYKNLIVGQMKGIKQQYEQATKRKDFDRLLSPDVAEDLKKHEGDGSKEKPLPLPKDGKYKKDKYYINDDGQVGKYTGEKNGQHVFE